MGNKEIELHALIAEIHAQHANIEGMKTENVERESNGFALAWGADQFFGVEIKFEKIASKIRNLNKQPDNKGEIINNAIDKLSKLTGEDFHGYRSEIWGVLSDVFEKRGLD